MWVQICITNISQYPSACPGIPLLVSIIGLPHAHMSRVYDHPITAQRQIHDMTHCEVVTGSHSQSRTKLKVVKWCQNKGALPVPNSMNFRKTSERGGGSFPIRKIWLRFFRKFWGGKNNEFSEKGGGSRQSEWISLQIFGLPKKAQHIFPFGSFPKIHWICSR